MTLKLHAAAFSFSLHPGEGSDDFKYFSGGFIAQKYGSSGNRFEKEREREKEFSLECVCTYCIDILVYLLSSFYFPGTLSEDGIGSAIDSVQAEVQRERRFNATLRNDFSEALGRAVAKFYRIHYD